MDDLEPLSLSGEGQLDHCAANAHEDAVTYSGVVAEKGTKPDLRIDGLLGPLAK